MPTQDTVGRLMRLVKILRILGKRDRVAVRDLANEFSVTPRTVHRDLKFLKEAGFKITRVGQGVYTAGGDQLEGLRFMEDEELAFVIASKRLVRRLLPGLERKVDDLLEGIGEGRYPPVHISADIPQVLSNRAQKTMRSLLSYISARCEVSFEYKGTKRMVEPYKLAYLKGFWYLLGKDSRDHKIKAYAVDRIDQLSPSGRRFGAVPPGLEEEIQRLYAPYLGDSVRERIVVRVDSGVAHYFKRKKFDPTQTIEEELETGDLIVSFMAVNTEPVKNFVIKPWLPHLVVLRPKELREEILAEMEEWVKKERDASV